VFIDLIQVLLNISSSSYSFVHEHSLDEETLELYERFVSLLAGYNYAYAKKERPTSEKYKEPEEVITFLHCSLAKIENALKKSKKDSELPSNTTSMLTLSIFLILIC
jgi:hypothetical protein